MRKKEVKRTVVWFLSGLLSFLFISEGMPKLLNSPEILEQFAAWGYPGWLLSFVGGVEMAGGILVMVPPVAFLAASALGGLMLGAGYTHLVHGEFMLLLKPLSFVAMIGIVMWLRRPRTGRKRLLLLHADRETASRAELGADVRLSVRT